MTRFLTFFWLGVAFVAGDIVGDGAGAGVGDSALLSDVSSAVSESSWLGVLGLGTENLRGSCSSSPSPSECWLM